MLSKSPFKLHYPHPNPILSLFTASIHSFIIFTKIKSNPTNAKPSSPVSPPLTPTLFCLLATSYRYMYMYSTVPGSGRRATYNNTTPSQPDTSPRTPATPPST